MEKICKHCGITFVRKPKTCTSEWAKQKFCSRKCANEDKKGKMPNNALNIYYQTNPHKLDNLKPGWNKGLSWSETIKKKMSDVKKGITFNTGRTHFKKGFTPWNKGTKGLQVSWNKGKKIPQITGEKHHNWKGGITPINHKIRTSFEYKYWRVEVFERDLYTCQMCNKLGGRLVSHHIYSFNNNPDKRTLISNGITLCKECHKNFHHIYGNRNNTEKQLLEFLNI